MNVNLTKISKKGQITIPQEIRNKLHVSSGNYLAVTSSEDVILIKKVETSDWDKIFAKGEKIAKEKKITQEVIIKACAEMRHST